MKNEIYYAKVKSYDMLLLDCGKNQHMLDYYFGADRKMYINKIIKVYTLPTHDIFFKYKNINKNLYWKFRWFEWIVEEKIYDRNKKLGKMLSK